MNLLIQEKGEPIISNAAPGLNGRKSDGKMMTACCNGRMARLLQQWVLFRQGYPSAFFIPMSKYVSSSRRKYYQAFTDAERNAGLLGRLDVTPFVLYYQEEVYRKLKPELLAPDVAEPYRKALEEGLVTEKESRLWGFVLSHYGNAGFSTKQLEKDYRDVAYATVRGFVLKFERLGLLRAQKYGARVKYSVQG